MRKLLRIQKNENIIENGGEEEETVMDKTDEVIGGRMTEEKAISSSMPCLPFSSSLVFALCGTAGNWDQPNQRVLNEASTPGNQTEIANPSRGRRH